MGAGRLTSRPGRLNSANDTVPIVQEAGWAPGQVWTGVKYVGHLESKERLRIQSAQLFHFS